MDKVIEERAKSLYYNHLNIDSTTYNYMWGQCSEDYKEAWRTIAKEDLK